MLSRLDDPADEVAAEVAVLVGHAAARDPLDLGRRDGETLRELGERDVERDVLAKPGDREPSSELPEEPEVVLPELRAGRGARGGASRSARGRARTRTRRPPRGRSRRSRRRSGSTIPEPPISIQPECLQTRAAIAVAEKAGDVGLDRGLREREVVRAEAHLPLLAEERAHEVEQRPLQVGERDAAVDGEPLDLMEDRDVRRVGGVTAVDAPERDHVHGRLLRLHDADLRRRGLGPEQRLFVEVERRERRPRRMPRREVERREVVVGGLDLAAVDDLVAEPEEDVLDLAPDLRDQVEVAAPRSVARKGDVDDVLGEAPVELAALERGASLRRLPRPAARRSAFRAMPGLAVANLAQRLRQLRVPTEIADADGLELVGRRRGRDRALRLAVRAPGRPSCVRLPSALLSQRRCRRPSQRPPERWS